MFVRYLFHLQLNIINKKPINKIRLIENMITGNIVYLNDIDYNTVWSYIFSNTHMRWKDHNKVKNWVNDSVKKIKKTI